MTTLVTTAVAAVSDLLYNISDIVKSGIQSIVRRYILISYDKVVLIWVPF
jgi:hypothetical protein